jgi:hypothetical protein
MKRFLLFALVFMLVLAACAPKAEAPAGDVLKVSDGTISKTYTVADLQALGATQASFKGVTYVGVTLTALLTDAGIDPANLTAVKAVASDGFTVNYDASLYAKDDTIVAYATVDGAMSADDGIFRMVLPDQEGKLNARQLVEIVAIP